MLSTLNSIIRPIHAVESLGSSRGRIELRLSSQKGSSSCKIEVMIVLGLLPGGKMIRNSKSPKCQSKKRRNVLRRLCRKEKLSMLIAILAWGTLAGLLVETLQPKTPILMKIRIIDISSYTMGRLSIIKKLNKNTFQMLSFKVRQILRLLFSF
jgi:hypothetical protein